MNNDNAASNVQALLQAAGAMHQQGRLKEAKAIYEDILKSDPTQLAALHLLGIIAAQSKHFQLAADLIAKAIAIEPENSAFYYNRGIVLKELKQLEAAVASYESAITIKPDYAEAYYNRGIVLRELGQLEAAVASYDRAIAMKPDFAEANWNKGFALLLGGDFEGGLPLYEWRWKKSDSGKRRRSFIQPLWLGNESLQGNRYCFTVSKGWAIRYSFVGMFPG